MQRSSPLALRRLEALYVLVGQPTEQVGAPDAMVIADLLFMF